MARNCMAKFPIRLMVLSILIAVSDQQSCLLHPGQQDGSEISGSSVSPVMSTGNLTSEYYQLKEKIDRTNEEIEKLRETIGSVQQHLGKEQAPPATDPNKEGDPKNNDDKTVANKSILLCCKLFISEGCNRSALDAIERAASLHSETVLTYKLEDCPYNRVRYTLVSYIVHDSTGTPIYSPLQQTVVAMVKAAYETINIKLQTGGHPRLGVVDDIVFHPLALASLDEAAWLAKALAANIGSVFRVPVFLYAEAHPTRKALETIRRELGFYNSNHMGNQWNGLQMPESFPESPNEGPAEVSPDRGVVMIGARPWVGLYNTPLMSANISIARRIARKVSARGGGLPGVQSLGLFHGENETEVACMILDPNQVGVDMVQNWVECLAAREGVGVKKGYSTDLSAEMTLEKYMNLSSANANK